MVVAAAEGVVVAIVAAAVWYSRDGGGSRMVVGAVKKWQSSTAVMLGLVKFTYLLPGGMKRVTEKCLRAPDSQGLVAQKQRLPFHAYQSIRILINTLT